MRCRKRYWRERYLWRTYNLTIALYDDMRNRQGDICAICGNLAKRLVVDHDHITGRIRGLLCSPCNMALGKLGDSIEGIERVLLYLKAVEGSLIELTEGTDNAG